MLRDLMRALAALVLVALYAAVMFWPHYGLRAHPALLAAVLAVQLLVILLFALKPAPRRRLLRFLTFGLIGAGAMVLAACNGLTGLPGSGSAANSQLLDAMTQIVKDPACGHTDRLSVTLGPVSTGQVFLERSCPGTNGTPAPKPADPAPSAQQ